MPRSPKTKGMPSHTKAEQSEMLYRNLISAGHKLSEKLKDKKYNKLLRRISDGIANATKANEFAEGTKNPIIGSIIDVFGTRGLDRVYTVGWCSVDDSAFTGGKITHLTSGGVSTITDTETGREYRYESRCVIYADITAVEDLPYDIRRWPSALARRYFSHRFERVVTAPVKNSDRTTKIFAVKSFTEKDLHHIRKINPYPNKAQLSKIEKERGPDKLEDSELHYEEEQ